MARKTVMMYNTHHELLIFVNKFPKGPLMPVDEPGIAPKANAGFMGIDSSAPRRDATESQRLLDTHHGPIERCPGLARVG
jgi:hypothetical protein